MKKLLFIAVVAAVASAFSADVPDQLEKGVYSVTLTQKGLDYVMTAKTYAQKTPSKADEFADLPETAEDAVAAAETYFETEIKPSFDEELQDLVTIQSITTKMVSKRISGTTEYRYVYTIKYNAPSVNASGVASTKVASTTLNGLYVVGYGDQDGTYIWNNKITESYTNTFAKADTTKSYSEMYDVESQAAERIVELGYKVGPNVGDVLEGSIEKKNVGKKFKVLWKEITKKNAVKLANGYLEDGFELIVDEMSVTGDGKADAGFNWFGENADMQGWGTGTAQKNEVGEYETVKTVAGNTVDQFNRLYGTWKFQADAAATKLAEKGQSIEQILATKRVELVK